MENLLSPFALLSVAPYLAPMSAFPPLPTVCIIKNCILVLTSLASNGVVSMRSSEHSKKISLAN